MKIQYAIAAPLAAIALTVLGLSACGGSSGSGTNDSSSTINVCTLVPSSQVAAVGGGTVIQATPSQLDSWPDPDAFDCTYDLSNGQEITVEVEVTSSTDAFDANSRGLTGGVFPVTSVPGIGNKAAASANGLAVLTGKDNIEITGVPGEQSGDHAGDIKLARILISALG